MAAMRAVKKMAPLVGDATGMAAAAAASAALCATTLNRSLWTGTHWRGASNWPVKHSSMRVYHPNPFSNGAKSRVLRCVLHPSTRMIKCWVQKTSRIRNIKKQNPVLFMIGGFRSHGDAVMSGTLHGQSWASLLGLGLLMPRQQLQSHIEQEVARNCAYDSSGECWLGQLTLAGAPAQSQWALDGSPSMNFDTAACAVWLGASLEDSDTLTVGSRAVVKLYHEIKNDIFDWKDLHMGPDGKQCEADVSTNLAGEPFVNAHYARQVSVVLLHCSYIVHSLPSLA